MSHHSAALASHACQSCLALAIVLDNDPNYTTDFTLNWLSKERFYDPRPVLDTTIMPLSELSHKQAFDIAHKCSVTIQKAIDSGFEEVSVGRYAATKFDDWYESGLYFDVR